MRPWYVSSNTVGGVVVAAVMWVAAGCAPFPVGGFERARTLEPGHMEIGGSISTARLPVKGAWIVEKDRGSEGEPTTGPPVPATYFRLGVAEHLDLGVGAAPGTVALTAKYGIMDSDDLMMAALGTVGVWNSRSEPRSTDRFEAASPLFFSFDLPLARRVAPWAEVNLSPTFGFMQLYASREAYLEEQDRAFFTIQSGFRIGANFAVWRVRIAPEIALLGTYRSDREEGGLGLYPGLGAFLVF